MDKPFLIPILVCMLFTADCNRIVQINIVLPALFIPYYEWLVDFPGWQKTPEKSVPIEIWTEYSDVSQLRSTNEWFPSTARLDLLLTISNPSVNKPVNGFQSSSVNRPPPQKA